MCGSLFHSAGAATAKPRLPMCLLGRVEEIDSLLSRVRLLDLIKINSLEYQKVVLKQDAMLNWEPVEFFRKGVT